MTWRTTLLREVKGLADDVVHRVAKQFEGSAETTENVAKAARMAKRLQTRKAANPPVKPLKQAPPKARMPEAAPKPKAKMPQPLAVKALPKPGPGLPEGASKPRGGQFWPDYNPGWRDGYDGYLSPEAAARGASDIYPLNDWLEKSLTKYYKRDFGAPEDPLRDLAVRGLHYDPDMTPEKWKATVDSYLYEDPIGSYTVPDYGETRHAQIRREDLLGQAPWLAKQPVTDKLYGIGGGGLDLSHFTDEMLNALRPERSGLPNDLAVDVSSLDRMSFPQAVERVGRINQWRAKQMEEAAAARLSSPAVQMYKEYPEAGMRWVELRSPDTPHLTPPEDWGWAALDNGNYRAPDGREYWPDPDRYGGFATDDDYWHHPDTAGGSRGDPRLEALQEQLKFEGDTMGHCVGGYCDDVASGRSRIFSLRDAKGMPHVTVETAKPSYGRNWDGLRHDLPDEASDEAWDAAMQALKGRGDDALFDAEGNLTPFGNAEHAREQDIFAHQWLTSSAPESIVQIKGKQNRAPNPEYLPYVQDFVKSGQWGEIGDLGNTGLVRLPDKRLLDQETFGDIIRNNNLDTLYSSYDFNARGFPSNPEKLGPEDWDQFSQYFDGYKRGGRVKAKMPVDLKVNTCGCGGCA